jgi:hypothetical protein
MAKPTNFRGELAIDGKVLKFGTVECTGATVDVATGLARVDGCVVSLGEAPGASVGDVFATSWSASGGTLTLSIWQDDATAATEDTTLSYLAWGTR